MAAGQRSLGDILLIDGDEEARKEACTALCSAGYDVIEASDGDKALRLLDSKSWRWAPKFVVIDTVLSGVSGFELLRRLGTKFEKKDTLLVMISKYKSPEDEMEASTAGAHGFVVKPLETTHLEDILGKIKAKKARAEAELEKLETI